MGGIHHEFAPSSLERLESCPWSYKNCQNYIQPEGRDAQRGTLLHQAIYDDAIFNQLGFVEQEIITEIRQVHILPWAKRGLEIFHELKVQVFSKNNILLTDGTLDLLVLNKSLTMASLKDWKFGNYEVAPADINRQIQAYVCGVFQQFPSVKVIYALPVQPAYGIANFDQQVEYKREEMPRLLLEIAEIIEHCKVATPVEANPTSANCRYCNQNHCVAFQNKMLSNFELMQLDSEILSDDEKEMTLDYADRLLCAEKAITKQMKLKTDRAKELIVAHGGSANFRVASGRITQTTNWRKLAIDYKITATDIERETTITESSPYLMPIMRRRNKFIGE
ncbi:MAG: DUF2800 domain-containing protein [Ruthenibacterium sp.]